MQATGPFPLELAEDGLFSLSLSNDACRGWGREKGWLGHHKLACSVMGSLALGKDEWEM